MKKGIFHEIDYRFKKIDFKVTFYLVPTPEAYKHSIPPDLKNITIFHRGEDIGAIISQKLSMDLVHKLHTKYCKLPKNNKK